ncbi:MAG: DNA polymerase ligase N-terminal domain-containing protein [Syntrophobacteraceae bacterium]|nr:hypothetical protein [Desulfobacteraceae bacterium]
MKLRFVVHEHHATHLHYDFRLEREGVLRSWAVPKGPSMDSKDKRLAIAVEDHSLQYGDFEGIIPEGQYGAGVVVIWDSGTYEPGEWREDRIVFTLDGTKLKGGFTLARLKGGGKEWLLIKRKDEYSLAGWKMKIRLTPELEAELRERVPPCSAS